MSELVNVTTRPNGKWHLLTGVSAAALIAILPQYAAAGDDRPTVWVELGAQLERLTNGQERFSPPFVAAMLDNPFTPPGEVQRPPRYSIGEEGRITFDPESSDWSFSAAVRYGRSNNSRNVHDQLPTPAPVAIVSIPILGYDSSSALPVRYGRFANTVSQIHSTHLVLDFMAGKDVGLGILGAHGSSALNAGIRFAQFTSRSKARIDSDPDLTVSYKYISHIGPYPVYIKQPQAGWDVYGGKINVSRSFSGVGPSLAWNSNATLFGNQESSLVTFDWGLNGAVLFGRQKTWAHHETMAHYKKTVPVGGGLAQGNLPTLYPTKSYTTARARSVIVPNVGGFAGLSLRFPNAKISLGYRIDAFFGAIDGGIDARKTYDRNFYGPFATISIGLGG